MKLPYFLCISALFFVSPVIQAEGNTEIATTSKTQSILGGLADVWISEGFTKINDKEIAKHFKTPPYPGEAWTFKEGNNKITVTFNIPYKGKRAFSEDDVPKVAEVMKRSMKDIAPELTTMEIKGHTVSRLVTSAPDNKNKGDSVQNILQLSVVKNELVLSSLHIPSKMSKKGYEKGISVLNSITD